MQYLYILEFAVIPFFVSLLMTGKLQALDGLTRTRADEHKCLPHLICINPTLLFANDSKTNSKFKESSPLDCRACQDKSIDI